MCQKKNLAACAPEAIRKALELSHFDSHTAQGHMAPQPRTRVRPPDQPGEPRVGAVLLALYNKNAATHLLFIRRQEHLQYHPGQISFPGGRQKGGETLQATAVRETFEEVGITPAAIVMLGALAPVYVPPSDFMVHPFVGWHEGVPAPRPDPREVAEIFEIPLEDLFTAELRGRETRELNGRQVTVPYFIIQGHKSWGATAMILNEFLERLALVA
jgi:8-oxo-dGTP pyrophosphatase MutT (NUDIX family)